MGISLVRLLFLLGGAVGTRIHSLTPRDISKGGGIIFIYGDGFSADNFNFQDPILGNKIWFYNDFETLPCASPVKKNWLLQNPQAPSTTKVVCSLPARQSEEGSKRYTMKMTVDGNEVENAADFSVAFENYWTPRLRKIDHRYGAPGDEVTIFGQIMTKNVGPGASDLDNFDEIDSKSLQNIFFGSANCELMNDMGDPRGVHLDKNSAGDFTREGNITCKTSGSFIGPQNASLLVSDAGLSVIEKSAYSVNSKGQAFFYHTLPTVSSVSTNTGASSGGSFLTLEGLGFDGYKDNTQVFINDARCENVDVTSTTLVCKTPAETEVGASTGGPRGLKYNLWKGEVVDETAIGAAVNALSAADSEEFLVDQGFIEKQMSDEQSDYTGKLSGLFIAPNSGKFSFAVCANDAAEVYLSTSDDSSAKAMVASAASKCNKNVPANGAYGDQIELVGGSNYWIEAVHVHRDSVASNKTNFLQISFKQFNTFLTEKSLTLASSERQGMVLKDTRILEKQKITVEGLSGDLTFTHNGVPSQTPADASDSSTWSDNLKSMFSWQCTGTQSTFKFRNDMEDKTYKFPGQGGDFYNNDAVEAYCGNGALWKPWNVLVKTGAWDSLGLNIKSDAKFACFAYKGMAFYNGIDLLIRFGTTSWAQWDAWVNLNVTMDDAKDDWNYKCIDLEEAVLRDAPNWVLNSLGGPNNIDMLRFVIPHTNNGRKEGWLDEISFGRRENIIERVAPAFPKTAMKMNEITVTEADGAVEIEFDPWTCQTPDETMSLLGVMGGTIEEMTTEAIGMELMMEQKEFLKTHDTATFLVGGGKVTVERVSKESPKMEGTFSLTWKGQTVNLPPYLPWYKLQEVYENEFGQMGIAMYDHKWDACYNYHISWGFEYIGGDQEEPVIDHSNIISHGEADSLHSGVWTSEDGHVKVVQPGGDFFRQPASGSDPQITVWVTGFLSICGDTADCSFSYDASLTPTIISVTDALVDGSVVLTISGTGFTTDPTDFSIDVGGRACEATEATAASVTCTLENGPAGVFDITLWVKSRGLATGSVTFTLSLTVASFSPSSGSVGGGTSLTVEGTGFPNSLEAWAVVGGMATVGGNPCEVTSSTYTEIQCITPPEGAARRRKRALAELSLTINGQTATGGSYNYDSSSTPTIASLSPATSTPAGGDTLTITGTSFDYESVFNKVTIGGKECAILTWTPAEITCTIPALSNGEHPVIVSTKDNGYADNSAVSGIMVAFTLTGASPRVGSLQGGTKMNIYGSGFGDCSIVQFKLGAEHTCEVADGGCSDTEVSCTVTKTATMHTVRNTGRHFKFGPGYMWEPAVVTVRPGDKVRWAWNLPVAQEGTGISVHSVASGAETDYDGQGFRSPGDKSAKGNYVYQFVSEGTFNYNTEDVIQDEAVFMSGKVVVVSPDVDEVVTITATYGSITAENIGGGAATAPTPPTDCSFADSSCATETVDDMEFTFASCLTAEISSVTISTGAAVGNVSTLMGFADAQLTIGGSGFSTVSCENSVKVGDSTCAVTEATEESITCDMDSSTITSLKGHAVSVNVMNNGYAIQKVADDTAGKLYVVPKISAISPLSGSWAGGSILTLTGTGLKPADGIVTINFGEAGSIQKGCAVVEVTSSKVACVVPDMTPKVGTDKMYPIDIYFSGEMLRAELDAAVTAEYTYTADLTPSSGEASPSVFTTSSPIEVAGSGFGSDASGVKVFLRTAGSSSVRRRRSIASRLEEISGQDTFGYGPRPKFVHEYWKSIKKERPSRSIEWIQAGSSRTKRALPSYLPTLTPEDHIDELEELFHPEVEHMHVRTVKRDVDIDAIGQELYEHIYNYQPEYLHRMKRSARRASLSRAKRSTEEELLEMSMEGTTEATVTAVTDTSVTFTAPELPAGSYDVLIYVSGSGNADATGTTLTSSAMADSIIPASGSTYGGQTVVIAGNGFSGSADDTSVAVGAAACVVTAVTSSSVTCTTPAGAEAAASFVVTSNGVEFPGVEYNYETASTPTVSSVTPDTGSGPQSLTIIGSNFGASPTVTIGDYDCSVTTSSADSITCNLPAIPGGEYKVVVSTTELGLSNDNTVYTSSLTASAMTPTSGSFGGGSLLTITGNGFDSANFPTVTVCEAECQVQEGVTDTELTCLTPANDGSGTESCDVTVTNPSGAFVMAGSFTYDDALTPQVTSLSPQRGGTGGGTEITVTGTGFAASGNKVMIDGVVCDITAESTTSITCLTNRHAGCIEVAVTVEVPGQGYGKNPVDGSTDFYYIDRWNSIFTWGGTGTPLAGELIHITEGQTIMLDTSTPILKMLLIDGGKLIYDRDANGLNLQSEFILIINGGALEIGTEDDRYLNDAQITMHGHTRCTELPIYGCKSIGVRDGTLDLHGEFVPMTWTRLADTAPIGATEITLENGVNWKAGSDIIVATTGGRASMGESEKMVIESVSADGKTVTLTKPLKYEHLSIMQTFGTHDIETRGEVGLLSRNIKIKGGVNQQFVTEIPACEKPFVANEEAEQSCFQGKFGEEIGTDEMGAIIFIHAKEIDKHLVTARISYTEFNEVGQAFRVGRYPIHFHINGNVTGSYVRGNAIHHSYNRAVTIHAVNHLLVEHNVVFDIKGLSFFIEDGIEEDNIIQYNLAVYTRQSSSLLNPDIQPGSFWIVNPNNIVQHNSVAGSTHFGFWYRVLKYPDGPSRTTSYCPARAPMGRFYNNSAHSNGLYGIWMFTAGEAGWHPHTGTKERGYCDGHPTTATFGDFIAWNNEIGVEIVEGGAIRFENMTLLDNEKSGIENIHSSGAERQNGEAYGASTFKNGVVIGHSKLTEKWENGDTFCTKHGVMNGWWGGDVENTEFYNFDRPNCAALSNCARCKPKWVGGKVQTNSLSFTDSPNKISWKWTMGGIYEDLDGSLCGSAGCKVVQKRDIYDPAHCVDDTDDEFSLIAGSWSESWLDLGLRENDTVKLEGSVCDDTMKFHPVGMNHYAPTSLMFNDVVFHNEFGHAYAPWRKKPPYKNGWAGILPEGTTNMFFWETMDHITNITYEMGAFIFPDEGDYLLLGHNFTQSPDVFTFNGEGANSSMGLDAPPTYDTAENFDWYWSGNETKELTYIVSYKDKTSRRKRGGAKPHEKHRDITFRVYRCQYADCLPPPPPTVPAGRPTEFVRWSSQDDWTSIGETKPVAGVDGIIEEWVTIPPGVWMVMDESPPPMVRLMIYGVLEVADDQDMTLSAEIIMIQGDLAQMVVGFADAPYTHNFELILRGNHETPDQPLPDGPNLGAKALGVFGMLQMHGLDVGRTWTRLAQDAEAGSNTLVLSEGIDCTYWGEGAEIIVAPTGFEPLEKEKMTIASCAGNTLTLNDTLEFTHLGSEYSLEDGSKKWNISAEIGLLTRNVKIIGEYYNDISVEEFGARVLVSKFKQEGQEYRGYAKLSNVEWVRGGQEGWTDAFDPRYALSFINHEESTDNDPNNKESYVKKCSFNFNYNAAIGLFNTDNVLVEDNVVFRTMEYGVRDEGIGNRYIHNLVVLTRFVGIHKNHRQNYYKRACFYFKESLDPEFRDNAAVACERAGFSGTGHICSSNKRWSNNVIHTVQDGIFVNTYFPAVEVREDKDCVVFRGFFVYRAYDYGVYLLTHDSVEMEDNMFVDCGVGIHPFLIRPRPTTHQLEYKHLRINNTLFVGRNDPSQCDTGENKPSYLWYDKERMKGATMWQGRNWHGHANGHAGLLWPIFSGIGVPLGKPWINGKPKSFPLLTGQVYLNDITFANYNPGSCDGQFDSAIRTNPRGDDMQFPIISAGIKFINVAESSKVWMDRPLDKLVVGEHCVDMHCDGLKKALLIDTDGSVIGDDLPGTIIADSAFEWEGNPTAGLGYFRVPKTMITTVEGDKIEFADKMPNQGIVRNEQCAWVEEWQAYKCHGINHRLLILESMDIDTLDRRLSPVAMLANPGANGYLDLINGPQDWSCCFGYACQKRVSNFYTIVGTNMMYEVHLTSIPPIHMRYRLKHNDGGDRVLLKQYFPKPQRIDIFVGDRFMAPNNIDLTSDSFAMLPADDKYIPSLASTINGENYFDPTSGFLYLLLDGSEVVDYKIQPSIVTKIGATINMDTFFEGDVAGNIAALLGIDPSNIRVTNIVRESRKKRFAPTWDNSESIIMEMTIEAPPKTSLNSTTTSSGAPALEIGDLKAAMGALANGFQNGSIGSALGINVTTMAIQKPIYVPTLEDLPPQCAWQDEDPLAECYLDPEDNAQEGVLWSVASQANATAKLEESLKVAELKQPKQLKMMTEPDQAWEMTPFGVQPKIYSVDQDGTYISTVGSEVDPWIVTASLVNGTGALVNNITCKFVSGICEFDNLAIDAMGNDYVINFCLTYGSDSVADVESTPFHVGGRPLSVKFTGLNTLNPAGTPFSAVVSIWDEALDEEAASSVAPLAASCTVSLSAAAAASGATLSGTTQVSVVDGKASFDDLEVTGTVTQGALDVSCSDADEFNHVGTSPEFNVHPYPETGNLKNTDTAFNYKGDAKTLASIMEALAAAMAEISTASA